jgi:DNA polymerase-3 subunit delta
MEIPEADGASLSGIYDQILQRGIPPETSLILTAESADERRAIFKKIAAAGFVIDCTVRSKRPWDPQMNPEAARARIRGLVAAAGKAIDEAAVAGIVQRTGASMRGLVSEVEKVLLYVGSRPAVTTADVLEVFSGSREASIFDLTNAVSGKDPAKALAAFRGLLAQREPVPAILGILAAEVRALIIARCALEQRLGGALDPAMSFEAFRSRILPRLGEGVQGDDGSASKLLAMNPFRAFRLLQAASAFSLQALLRGLEAIHETDLSLKSAGYPEALLLEQLLIRLCAGPAPSSPSPAASGRA